MSCQEYQPTSNPHPTCCKTHLFFIAVSITNCAYFPSEYDFSGNDLIAHSNNPIKQEISLVKTQPKLRNCKHAQILTEFRECLIKCLRSGSVRAFNDNSITAIKEFFNRNLHVYFGLAKSCGDILFNDVYFRNINAEFIKIICQSPETSENWSFLRLFFYYNARKILDPLLPCIPAEEDEFLQRLLVLLPFIHDDNISLLLQQIFEFTYNRLYIRKKFLVEVLEYIDLNFSCRKYFYDKSIWRTKDFSHVWACWTCAPSELRRFALSILYKYHFPLFLHENSNYSNLFNPNAIGKQRAHHRYLFPELTKFLQLPRVSKRMPPKALHYPLIFASYSHRKSFSDKNWASLISEIGLISTRELRYSLEYLVRTPSKRAFIAPLMNSPVIRQKFAKIHHQAIHYLIHWNEPSLIEELLRFGSRIDTLDSEKRTALMHAIIERNEKIIRLLLPFTSKDTINTGWIDLNDGLTPLHYIVKMRRESLLQYFLELFPNAIDIPTEKRVTSLMHASACGWIEGVKLLLSSGVSKNVVSFSKNPSHTAPPYITASQLAKLKGHIDVYNYINEYLSGCA